MVLSGVLLTAVVLGPFIAIATHGGWRAHDRRTPSVGCRRVASKLNKMIGIRNNGASRCFVDCGNFKGCCIVTATCGRRAASSTI